MVKTALYLATHPKDAFLAMHMAAFIAAVPRMLAKSDLSAALTRIRSGRALPRANFERIRRIRGACLRLPPFAKRNTCYIRALTLYRYLDVPDASVRVHLGIERHTSRHTRLHGHAWVTLDGALLEGPPEVADGRIHEIPIPRGTPS